MIRCTKIHCRKERPGPGWHAHGTFTKTVYVVVGDDLVLVRLVKQRWFDSSTKSTKHDRPFWDPPYSPYAYDLVFSVMYAWLAMGVGLLRAQWPWNTEQPSRRTAQRMRARLEPDALRWQVAVRRGLTQYVAPRPLEEFLSAGGIPPPRGCTLDHANPFNDQISEVSWLLKKCVHTLSITMRQLLGVAQRSWEKQCDQLP